MKLRKLWPIAALISLVFLLAAPAAFGAAASPHISSDEFKIEEGQGAGESEVFTFKMDGTFSLPDGTAGEWFFWPFSSCIIWNLDSLDYKYTGVFCPFTTGKGEVFAKQKNPGVGKRFREQKPISTGTCKPKK